MTITAILAAVLFAPQPLPVPPETTGTLADKPITIIRNDESELRVAQPGSTPVLMGTQDYRYWMQTILVPNLPSGFRINSFSRGMGVMATEYDDLLDRIILVVPGGGWSFIVYGVDNADGGDWLLDGIYKTEAEAEGGVLGDTFSYVAPESESAYPPEELGVIMKFRDGLDLGATSLRGLDTYMPGWFLGGDSAEDIGLEGALFFFTVVSTSGTGPAAYAGIPGEWGPLGTSGWKGPATIFSVEYKDDAWQTPTVYKEANELGLFLHEGDDVEEPMTVIDGLSVQDNEEGAEVVLSTSGDVPDLQLWVTGRWEDDNGILVPHAGPLRTSGGELYVTDRLRIPPGKGVRSICNDDPRGMEVTSPRHHDFCQRTAVKDMTAPPGSRMLDIPSHRVFSLASSTDLYRFVLQGFISGNDRIAQLVLLNANQVVATVSRDRSRGVDRKVVNIPVPKTLSTERWTYVWEVRDSRGTLIGRSHQFYFYPN